MTSHGDLLKYVVLQYNQLHQVGKGDCVGKTNKAEFEVELLLHFVSLRNKI